MSHDLKPTLSDGAAAARLILASTLTGSLILNDATQ
jgi:hypothetical protein